MENHRKLLIAAYDGFNRRDLESVLKLMHQEVDWPNGMEGGRVHGHEGVRAYWTRQWSRIDPHVDPLGFEDGEQGEIVVEVHQVVRELDGRVLLDEMVLHVYRIDEGLIRGMEIRRRVPSAADPG